MTIHEKYHTLAEQSLAKGKVDVEAYIVKVLSEMAMGNSGQVASVQTTQKPYIDVTELQRVKSTNDYFKRFISTNSEQDFNSMIAQTEQILTEVRHSLDSADRISIFDDFIDRLQKIK